MSDDIHDIIQEPEASFQPSQEKSYDAFRELATSSLYLNSPFRRTGLKVLAGARDISRRADQLKMAVELGVHDARWAFASQSVPDTDQVREAVQRLKDPRSRLAYEFFWFWPDSYPEDTPDLGTGYLAEGVIGLAVDHWLAGAAADGEVGLHNLAVYYHLVALDLENTAGVDEEELGDLWRKAFSYWAIVFKNDAFWERLRARLIGLADAQLPVECAAQMRASLIDTLVRINASLALGHADRGQLARVALQASLISTIQEDPDRARRSLEDCAAPIARRIETRLRATRRRVEHAPETGLREAVAVLKQCRDDIRAVDTICGAASEFYREVSHSVVALALDCLVAYQRATEGNHACLALLTYLFTFEASPELKRRLQHSFEVIRDNAMNGESSELVGTANEGGGPRKADYERFYHVLAEDVAPGASELDLDEQAQREYSARATEFLANLALEACEEHDNIKLAMRAFATAIELPNDEDVRYRLEEARDQLLRDFKLRKEKEVLLEREGFALEITRRGLRYNEQWISPDELTGVRHGVVVPVGTTVSLVQSYVIAWKSAAGEFVLDEQNAFTEPAQAEANYSRIIESFYYFMVTPLIERLAAQVRNDEPISMGAHAITREGWRFAVRGRFWKTEELVSYERLKYRIEGGELTVSSSDDPKLSEVYRTAVDWNAAILGYVIDVLAQG